MPGPFNFKKQTPVEVVVPAAAAAAVAVVVDAALATFINYDFKILRVCSPLERLKQKIE